MSRYEKGHPVARGFRIAGLAVLGVLTAVIFALIFGYFVMLLWNWLMPDIFSLKTITYWQAFGIVLLTRLIFGSIGQHHGHNKRHKKYEKYENADWREKEEWKSGRRYYEWWKNEGKASYEAYKQKMNIDYENRPDAEQSKDNEQ